MRDPLPARVATSLQRAGLTLDDARQLDDVELLKVRGIGRRSLRYIRGDAPTPFLIAGRVVAWFGARAEALATLRELRRRLPDAELSVPGAQEERP